MKLRNVRSRQWRRHLRHNMALTKRLAPYTVTDEFGTYLAWPLALLPGYNRAVGRDVARWTANHRNRRKYWRRVEHEGQWEPADLRIDAEGNTRPGFVCVHQLENGNGQCGSSIFRIEDAIGTHACIVRKGGPGW